MKCSKCGRDLYPGSQFCDDCGKEVSEKQQNAYKVQKDNGVTFSPQKAQGNQSVGDVNATAMLIWSVFNIVLCCLPLGIVGLIMSLNINKAQDQMGAEEAYRKAKMWNMIGTSSGVFFVVLYIVVSVVAYE